MSAFNVAVGAIICHKLTGNRYFIVAVEDKKVLAVAVEEFCNPSEWEVIGKHEEDK
jgi:hypothetical protein